MKHALLTLALLTAPVLYAQDAPAPAPEVSLPDDPTKAFELFTHTRQDYIAKRRKGTKDERKARLEKLRVVCAAVLEAMPGKIKDSELEKVMRTYRFAGRSKKGSYEALVEGIKNNANTSQRFKDGLAAVAAYEELGKLVGQVHRMRRKRKPAAEVDAVRDQVYAKLGPWLDAHAEKAFAGELYGALKELRYNAKRKQEPQVYDERMKSLTAIKAKLPEAVQTLITEHSLRVGAAAPGWKAVALEGGAEITLESLRGKLVLMDFWASWCGPCLGLAKRELIPLHAKYKDDARLKIVGLGLSWQGDTIEKQKATAAKFGVKYTKVFDAEAASAKAYGVSGIPYLVLVGEDGKILVKGSGWQAIKKIKAELAKRLGGGKSDEKPAEKAQPGSK